jgi:NitT/TauT family transport system substrate-binding protein
MYYFAIMRRCILAFCFAILFLGCAAGAAHAQAVPLKKASFIPQWSPQAQFAGYYVAYEKGIYKKHGIDLEIIQGGPNRSSFEALKNGEATFATMWLADAIQKRTRGVKIVNIAQIVQRSALMLVAKKTSGINKPADMNGKKVGLWGGDFQIQPRAFLKKYNLNVKIVPQAYSVNLFLRDGVQVASAMWYNEYHTIINAGLDPEEITAFFFYEHGLNFPEDGIYTTERIFNNDPDFSKAFATASVEGWLYAFKHPDEALGIVLKYMSDAKVPANKVHQKWMLERMKDLILPRNDKDPLIGVLKEEEYARVARELQSGGYIKGIPAFASFYKQSVNHAEK